MPRLNIPFVLFIATVCLSLFLGSALAKDNDITRQELLNFDRFLDSHPAIAKDPELRQFLANHPEIRNELRENPRVVMRRERKFDKQENKLEKQQRKEAKRKQAELERQERRIERKETRLAQHAGKHFN